MTLLRDFAARLGRNQPTATAFVSGATRRTWRELDERSDRFAAALAGLGIGPGDAVGILAHERVEVYEHLVACYKLGAPRVGINWRFALEEMLHVIRDADLRALLVEASCMEVLAPAREALEREGRLLIGFRGAHGLAHDYEQLLAAASTPPPWPDLDEHAVGAISYTSGTTGLPKGVLLSHHGLREATVHTVTNIGLTPSDVWYCPASSAWVVFILSALNLANGMTSVIPDGDYDTEGYLDDIERNRVSVTLAVPTMLLRILDAIAARPRELGSLRLLLFGSSPSPPALIRRVADTLRVPLAQIYGLTECTGGWVAGMRPEDTERALQREPRLLRSTGRAYTHFDIEVRDGDGRVLPAGETGEVWLRSDTSMLGYHHLPELTRETLVDGWLRTRDLGYLDEEGFLFLIDRADDVIITGAANVHPSSVERVLAEHPAVAEVAAVGAPHPEWGRAVVAVVVAREAVTPEALRAFCAEHLARFEVPKHVVLVDALPKGLTGKVLRKQIRAWFEDGTQPLPWDSGTDATP